MSQHFGTLSAYVLTAAVLAAVILRAPVVSGAQAPAPPAPGLTIFREKGCDHCHGSNLEGTEKGPNLTGVGRRLSRLEISHQIHFGGGNMPPFGDVIDAADLARLTRFLSQQRAEISREQRTPR